MKSIELSPIDSRESFYGKAKLIIKGDLRHLQSYNTIVAEYNYKTGKMNVKGWYSATTARHINAFLDFYGFAICNKKELSNYKLLVG